MAIPKVPRPAEGPESYDALDRALIAGFINPAAVIPFGRQKVLATGLRMRMLAVGRWVTDGKSLNTEELAQELKVSKRCVSDHFPNRNGLYAFPPPEFAMAMVDASQPSRDWSEIARLVRPIFEELNQNKEGRQLFADLVSLHRVQPRLCETDGYFSLALRNGILGRRERHTLAIVGLYTDGLRFAFEEWFDAGRPSTMFVADRAEALLVGPVKDAFESLSIPARPAKSVGSAGR